MKCNLCKEVFEAPHKNTKYCKPCRPIMARERARDRYYNKVRPKIDGIDEYTAASEALRIARESGATHFIGRRCKKGHDGKRLVSTQQCCGCLKERSVKRRKTSDEYLALARKNQIRRGFARNLGKTRFKSMLTCIRGHLEERLVSTNQCCECLKEREVRKANKDHAINRERVNAIRRSRKGRARNRIYYREVKSSCERHRLTSFMRACVRRTIKHKNGLKSKVQLGYSHIELKNHLESLFKDGMSWDNYGEWHIDHIKPIKAFLDEGVDDPAIVNSLNNLAPLWAKENLSKGSSY